MKNLNTIKKVVTAVVITFLLAVAGSNIYAAFPPTTVSQGGTGWNAIQSGSVIFGDTSLRVGTSTAFQYDSLTSELQVTNLSATNGTTTNATTTSFAILDLTSAILQVDSNGSVSEYAGTVCTNQFVRSLSALGSATCETVANTDLANSTISGISLGSSLADLTATDSTLTFSGTYNGGTARTIGLNLGNENTWTAGQIFTTSTTTSATTTNFAITSLGTSAGAFIAVDPNGTVIATTTPSGGSSAIAPIGSDGNDGDVNVTSEITLTRDMFYDNLVVESGGIINAGGYRIFGKTSVTVDSGGTIRSNGTDGGAGDNAAGPCASEQGGTAGTAPTAGTLPAGVDGVAGANSGCATNGVAGNNGTAITKAMVDWNGRAGGAGGSATGSGGAASSGGATSSSITNFPRNAQAAFTLWEFDSTTSTSTVRFNITAGAGSGGSGGNTSSCNNDGAAGGGSGASGGVVWISTPTFLNNGTVQANGGAGGVGGNGAGCTPKSGGGGGGGGGNGGVVFILAGSYTDNATVEAAGGTGGTGGTSGGGGNAGSNGTTGKDGEVIIIRN